MLVIHSDSGLGKRFLRPVLGSRRLSVLFQTHFHGSIVSRKMNSTTQNQINRLRKEIADLRISDAREAKREANIVAKINRSNEAVSRTKNTSARQSKAREVERGLKDSANVQMKRANISKKISEKEKQLALYQERQTKEISRETKRQSDLEKRLIRKREQRKQRIAKEFQPYAKIQSITSDTYRPVLKHRNTYDFFISHASEDKDSFVRDLAGALKDEGVEVWFDEFILKVGDSLRRKIDQGLCESRFGIVVISKNFLAKEWPQKELDGLVSLEVDGQNRILPIWHEISKDEVIQYSPILADKVALNTANQSTQEIVSELTQLIGGED